MSCMLPFPIKAKLKGTLQRFMDSFKYLCSKPVLQKSPNTWASVSIGIPAVCWFFVMVGFFFFF